MKAVTIGSDNFLAEHSRIQRLGMNDRWHFPCLKPEGIAQSENYTSSGARNNVIRIWADHPIECLVFSPPLEIGQDRDPVSRVCATGSERAHHIQKSELVIRIN